MIPAIIAGPDENAAGIPAIIREPIIIPVIAAIPAGVTTGIPIMAAISVGICVTAGQRCGERQPQRNPRRHCMFLKKLSDHHARYVSVPFCPTSTRRAAV
jgi:hypothetical protein